MLKSSASRYFLNNSYFFVSHIVTKQKNFELFRKSYILWRFQLE